MATDVDAPVEHVLEPCAERVDLDEQRGVGWTWRGRGSRGCLQLRVERGVLGAKAGETGAVVRALGAR
jgi:hypothetical protein